MPLHSDYGRDYKYVCHTQADSFFLMKVGDMTFDELVDQKEEQDITFDELVDQKEEQDRVRMYGIGVSMEDDAEAKKMKYTLMREGLTLVKPEKIEEWLQFVDNYSNNSYSAFIVKATISMMEKMEEGISFEKAEQQVYKAEQQVYNEKLELNNYTKYSIASALSHFSKQGEEYRKYWNKKYGIEEADEKGTVNPTVLFKEKK